MKQVNDSFKENIKKYGRSLDCKIILKNTTIEKENINSIVPSVNTSLFKSVMYGLEIDSNIEIPQKTKIDVKVGVKFGTSNYEYIEFKDYAVYSCEIQEDTESYKIIAYDKMLESMIDFNLEITENLTVKEYLIKNFQKLNWSIEGIPDTFINSTKVIEAGIHSDIDYTFRDVFDEIATITGSFIYIKNGIPTLGYIEETNEIINEEYLSQDDVTIGEKYFINSLVFSRAEESDNIFRKNDISIEANGLHEFRISDNQILSTNNRVDFIDELYSYLQTLEFYIYDVKSTGILWFEICDMFTLSIHNKTYPTIILNDEITIDQDVEEKLYVEKPEETETNYKCADSTDKKINKAYILVDKQNKKITQLTQETTENTEKIAKVEQDIDGIKQIVSNTAEYKRNSEGITQIYLENAGQAEILELNIQGNKTYENNLFPSENLYPSEELYSNMEGSELL